MIQFDEYGNRNNPTILLLHGAGALDTFTRQYCFANKYHLVVPHLPGAGENAHIPYLPAETISLLHELIKSLHKENIGVVGHSLGAQIVSYGMQFVGCPYVWGGTTPAGFDCSGLTQYVYRHFGIYIGRTSRMRPPRTRVQALRAWRPARGGAARPAIQASLCRQSSFSAP